MCHSRYKHWTPVQLSNSNNLNYMAIWHNPPYSTSQINNTFSIGTASMKLEGRSVEHTSPLWTTHPRYQTPVTQTIILIPDPGRIWSGLLIMLNHSFSGPKAIERQISGCVVECRICNREVAGLKLGLGYFAPRSTQPSIPPGSVNEYQLRLGRQRQV